MDEVNLSDSLPEILTRQGQVEMAQRWLRRDDYELEKFSENRTLAIAAYALSYVEPNHNLVREAIKATE